VDDETRRYIDIQIKRLDDLREADLSGVRLAHHDLSERLEGFPQQFATSEEVQGAKDTLQRLERDAISREVYDANTKAMNDLLQKMDKEKMPEAVFKTFVDNYRIDREEGAQERRAVAAALAHQTERRAGVQEGSAASWKQIAAVIGLFSFLLSTVVVMANWLLQ
jgi:hypothetical protein